MALLPAAMFAMFFFLSLFIQNVMGYSPLKTGVAFLPFSVGIVLSAGDRVQPGRPDRRPLHRRHRHADRCGVPVRVLPAGRPRPRHRRRLGGPERSAARRRHQLLDAAVPVHLPDGGRHGRRVRAAHPDGRPPRAHGGLRHRVGRAQHHAADRRRAGSGDPGHRREPRDDRAHREDRAGRRQRAPAGRPQRAGRPDDQPRCELLPGPGGTGRLPRLVHPGCDRRVRGRRLPDAGRIRGGLAFLDVKHEELATDGPAEGVHVG